MPQLSEAFRTSTSISIKEVGIVCKVNHPPAVKLARDISKIFELAGVTTSLSEFKGNIDALIVLGGDGTLLRIADRAAHHSIPVLGINMGNLGFLTERTEQEAITAVEELLSGTVTIENRMMLKASITTQGEVVSSTYALNEVVISKETFDPILQLSTRADLEYITTYKADGLIFSTPTGSTAYNLSAGGPLVYPGLASILVTPICPFMLGSRPVLLPPHSRLRTRLETSRDQKAQVIVDGHPAWAMKKDDTLEIEAAQHSLRLVISPHRDYFAILRNKLHWGIGSSSAD